MIHGSFGAPAQIDAVGENPRARLVKDLVEMIHGERAFSPYQRAHGELLMEQIVARMEARGSAGRHPLITPADFALLYKMFVG